MTMHRITQFSTTTTRATNAASVDFTIAFDRPVTGLSPADFTVRIASGSMQGVRIDAITPLSTDGTRYTVRVDTGSGDGQIALDYAPVTATAADGVLLRDNFGFNQYIIGNAKVELREGDWVDLNGDGLQDLITPNSWSQLEFFHNGIMHRVFINEPMATLRAADMTGDGRPDIVAGLTAGKIFLYTNQGDFAFTRSTIDTPVVANILRLGDVTGDRVRDFVYTDGTSSAVYVTRGGNGATTMMATPGAVRDIGLADMNRDGILDVVSAHATGISVNQGSPLLVQGGVTDIALADINRDGHTDIAAISASGGVLLFQGSANGTFTQRALNLGQAASIAVADVNSDGINDLILGRPAANMDARIGVAFGRSDGTYNTARDVPFLGNWSAAVVAIDIVDQNGDSRPDLQVTTQLGEWRYLNILTGFGSYDTARSASVATIDKTPPAVPTLTMPELITSQRLSATGTATPGSFIELHINTGGAVTQITGIQAGDDGRWGWQSQTDYPPGRYTATARSADAVGNLSGFSAAGITNIDPNAGKPVDPNRYGTSGYDVVDLPGSAGAASLTHDGVNWSATGPFGKSVLFNVEAVRFADGQITLTRPMNFDGNGTSDILWRGSSGEVATWTVQGPAIIAASGHGTPSLDWTVAGTGDFNADGVADILWRHSSGTVGTWTMLNGSFQGASLGNPTNYWQVKGIGDFNGDGRADILWQGQGGEVVSWEMHASGVHARSHHNVGTYWQVTATGDLNADGRADLIWRGQAGEVAVWLMDGTLTAGVSLPNPGHYWRVVGAGDIDRNGTADLTWQGLGGEIATWQMRGTSLQAATHIFNPGTYWRAESVGDYNGDLRADILFRGAQGEVAMWLMDGTRIAAAHSLFNPGGYWDIVA